jgi:hypothetical protein
MERKIEEALNTLEEIRQLFKRETLFLFRWFRWEILIWGLYQLITPIIVYLTQNYFYFLLIAAICYAIDQGRIVGWPGVFYWITGSIVLLLSLWFKELYITLGMAVGIIVLSFLFMMFIKARKGTKIVEVVKKRSSNVALVFVYLFIFCGIFLMGIFITGAHELQYIMWSGFILYTLGMWGIFSERSLFIFSLCGNLVGILAFALLPAHYRIFTVSFYGLVYVIYFIYLSIQIRQLNYGSSNS